MSNILEEALSFLTEEVYGNLATVYHRTDYKNLVNSIHTEGFKPGGGAAYGKGFYATYDLASQEKGEMAVNYGDLVVKFVVPTENFFFFEYEEFIKSPLSRRLKSNKETFILDQMEHYKLSITREGADINRLKKYNESWMFADWFNSNTDLRKKVKGIVYKSNRDGKTLLSYDTGGIIPVAYKKDSDDNFTKVNRDRAHFKRAVKSKNTPFPIKQRHKASTEWINKAKTKNGEFEVWKGVLTWYGGEWLSGVWVGGVWEKGIWRNGTWLRGEWHKGEWFDGIWKAGDWFAGMWHGGTWESGNWQHGWIKDVNKKGNFDKSWKWDSNDEFVYSPISPKEYWKGKQQ